ncbi:MAG: hypothetical protein JRI63_14490, partial [Deltaproteobacteria bacterium]|nr:hypothetical protein [Deltaproteobacteria bacterium]
WLFQIKEKIFAELKMNSPDIVFIPAVSRNNAESDYIMTFDINYIEAGEDIEVGGIHTGEYEHSGLLLGEYNAFHVVSVLKQTKHCRYERTGVLEAEDTVSKYGNYENDIFIAIEHNIDGYGSISGRIEEYEASHPVPPRGPEILVTLKKEYVSPLEAEREMEIRIKVKNCKGQEVWERTHGLAVLLPRTTARGEIKETPEFRDKQGSIMTSNLVKILIQRPEGASVTYTLKKGMERSIDKLKIHVCGMRKEVTKEVFIPVAGIALRGESEGYVFPEKTTEIKFHLTKLMPQGGEQPLGGKSVRLSPEGLIDGTVSPAGKTLTHQNGNITIRYKSGLKENTMTVHATFQPKKYPDKVRASAGVTIIEKGYDWTGTVIVNQTCSYQQNEIKNNKRGFWIREESILSTDRTAHLTIRFLTTPGKPAVILGKDVSGTSRYLLKTFEQKGWADCKDKQTGKTVKKKPGDTQECEIKVIGTLVERNLDISPSIHLDRLSNRYTFDFSVSGLRWRGKMTRTDIYTDVCSGNSKEKSIGPFEEEGQKYDLQPLHYEGQVQDINTISGSTKIETATLEKCNTTYNWNLKRISQ